MAIIYSHSKLSSFEQCPLKYKFRYIDNIEPEIKQTIEGFLGNRVHDTLEYLYNEIKKDSRVPELDEIIKFYNNLWYQEYSEDIKIVNENMNVEYYYNLGIKFLIDYYFSNRPFKDNTIATEMKITVSLDSEEKFQIQGYIDRLVHHKDTNIFEIHDYKTGNFLKSQEELDKDRQLALYSLGIRDMFPEAKDVLLIWHFLAFNKKIISKRTIEELEKLKQDTILLINKIENAKNFPAKPSCLCKWCEFQKICPEVKFELIKENVDICKIEDNGV
ncbi:MAG: PD-(D/E)XK nuclease family protein [Candidatus Pacearchaeota archaeon]